MTKETRDIKTALAESLEPTNWEWLKPHAQRDALIIVSPSLDIIEVGVAIANDQTESVQQWIQNEQLQKPSANQLSLWNGQPTKAFNTLIVQPYVLVQELPVNATDQAPDANDAD
ncbi:MAG: DUF2288 domain-containing protein [Halothece sp.]